MDQADVFLMQNWEHVQVSFNSSGDERYFGFFLLPIWTALVQIVAIVVGGEMGPRLQLTPTVSQCHSRLIRLLCEIRTSKFSYFFFCGQNFGEINVFVDSLWAKWFRRFDPPGLIACYAVLFVPLAYFWTPSFTTERFPRCGFFKSTHVEFKWLVSIVFMAI